MSERVDLGLCAAIRHDGSAGRCAVVLPGMMYPTRAPVLWFARKAAMGLGYSALEVLGEPDSPSLQVVELPDVDHALQVTGDPVASIDALRRMTEALTVWLRRLPLQRGGFPIAAAFP